MPFQLDIEEAKLQNKTVDSSNKFDDFWLENTKIYKKIKKLNDIKPMIYHVSKQSMFRESY